MNEGVYNTFKILGLNDIMTITDTEESAKTMMKG
jgi:anti-anti-sigma regulatory factor